jgi:hypothetical protein
VFTVLRKCTVGLRDRAALSNLYALLLLKVKAPVPKHQGIRMCVGGVGIPKFQVDFVLT